MVKSTKPAISTIKRKASELFEAPEEYFNASHTAPNASLIRAYAIYVAFKYGHTEEEIKDAFGYIRIKGVRDAIKKVSKSIDEGIAGFEKNTTRLKLFIEDKLESYKPEDNRHSLLSIRSAVAQVFDLESPESLKISEHTKSQLFGRARAIFLIVARQSGHSFEDIVSELNMRSIAYANDVFDKNDLRMTNRTHQIFQNVQAVKQLLRKADNSSASSDFTNE